MHNIIDLQLVEYATRESYEERLRSLFNSMQDIFAAGECTEGDWADFMVAKNQGTAACKGFMGYEILLKRELDFKSKTYAYQDVQLMAKYYGWKLRQIQANLDQSLLTKIMAESRKRADKCLEELEENRNNPRLGPACLRRRAPPVMEERRGFEP